MVLTRYGDEIGFRSSCLLSHAPMEFGLKRGGLCADLLNLPIRDGWGHERGPLRGFKELAFKLTRPSGSLSIFCITFRICFFIRKMSIEVAGQWMAVNVWVSGLIHSPQSHIIKSVMLGMAFVGFSVCDVACWLLAVTMESGRRGD
ncbi:hypothetical protein TNCV_5106591 [Trichonephila clavipes]|uniref:Uncharacterized protein n=1 Tax=Trichonephila clavipes TaxID=2585209 RepID=A0A8X6RF14_TRICX|nr:hypothetical protein TNCV_5106591 [Trichonephila clavipes]